MGGTVEGWPVTLADIPVQGELAYDEGVCSNIF